MKGFVYVLLTLFFSSSVFSEEHLSPRSDLYINESGQDSINGSGNIALDCSVISLGPRSDAGHDLKTFIDGNQENALTDESYIEGAFPVCRQEMGCEGHMTLSQSGYDERTVFQVQCALVDFKKFKDGQYDQRLYKEPAWDGAGVANCDPIVIESEQSKSVDKEHVCMGKEGTETYQEDDLYKKWVQYKRVETEEPDPTPENPDNKKITITFEPTGTYFLKDMKKTGKIITDSRIVNNRDNVKQVPKLDKFGSKSIEDYNFYANSTTYETSDVKFDLTNIEVKLYKDGSELSRFSSVCATPGSICQEGVKIIGIGADPNAKDIELRGIGGEDSVTFLVVVRNRGSEIKGAKFNAHLMASLSVKKEDGSDLWDGTPTASALGKSNDGGFVRKLAENVTLEDQLELDDLKDVSCVLQFDGRDEGKSGENYLGESGGVDLWSVGYAIKNNKVPITPILVGDLPDYLMYPNRDDIIWPSGQDAIAIDLEDGISDDEKMVNVQGEVELLDVGVEYTIGAEIKLFGDEKRKIICKNEKLKRLPKPLTIGIKPYSQCGLFVALREYYFDPESMVDLNIPGSGGAVLPAQTLPLTGLYNAAQWGYAREESPKISKEKELQIEYKNSSPVMPSPNQRRFHKTFLTIKKFTEDGISPRPIMIGRVGAGGDFSTVELKNIVSDNELDNMMADAEPDNKDETAQDHFVVAEICAKGQPFIEGSEEHYSCRQGIDMPIPFASSSCLAKMPFRMPMKLKGGKSVRFPAEIENSSLCRYSIPIKLNDVAEGLASLQVVNLAPINKLDSYPVELMRRSASMQSCSQNAGGEMVDCWDIKSYIPASAAEAPNKTHSDCHKRVCKEYKSTYPCGRYGRDTCTAPEPVKVCHDEYDTSCQIFETDSKNECNSNMAFRFDGYFNQMVASLGCVAKYDGIANDEIRNPREPDQAVNLSGVTVAASLFGEGIMPYQKNANSEVTGQQATGGAQGGSVVETQVSMGGSDPMNYNEYPDDKVQKGTDGALGYQCIPCQFGGLPWLEGSLNTAVLPLDQGSTQNPRKPEYSFNKRQEASECVKKTTFQVRYFGSNACNGVDNPPGHFCASRNLSPKTCPASQNGNVAGSFSINLCSGSQFGTSNVSASWSPILIDVVGKDIIVTRSADMAVDFDMQGKGEKMLVDWPLNTYDIAFLVEPNKDGKVTSARQLFGDLGFKNGFDKLMKKYDKDAKGKSDGKINHKDLKFSNLKLWFDRNRNGITDAGEIETLEKYGVHEISLDYFISDSIGLDSKTLSSTYWNVKKQRYMNVIDAFFGAHKQRYHGKLDGTGTGVNRQLSSLSGPQKGKVPRAKVSKK